MSFARKHEEFKERRQAEREANLAALAVPTRSLHAGSYAGGTSGEAVSKAPAGRMQALRDSARGEDCTVRIQGCSFDPEKTIWSHLRGSAGGKGMGVKSFDLCGAYACTYCDGVYDGQISRPAGWTKQDVDLAWHDGHIRSLVRLAEKGLLRRLFTN